MQPDIPLLQQTILFSGIEAEELRHLLILPMYRRNVRCLQSFRVMLCFRT